MKTRRMKTRRNFDFPLASLAIVLAFGSSLGVAKAEALTANAVNVQLASLPDMYYQTPESQGMLVSSRLSTIDDLILEEMDFRPLSLVGPPTLAQTLSSDAPPAPIRAGGPESVESHNTLGY